MAATDSPRGRINPFLAAALALPGIAPATALAQSMPEQGIFALNYLDYRDWQPGGDRMSVRSPSFYVLAPFADKWTVEGSVVYDSMSGASPLWFNTLSGASGEGVTDYRTAGDVKVTHYFNRYSIDVGGASSHERDYSSRAGSLDARWWTADKNTTLAFGFAGNADYIHPSARELDNGRRNTLDFLVGITQALSPVDSVQSNVTYSTGHGYFSDPYKPLDTRPGERRVLAWLTRYNHRYTQADATLQLGYRLLDDSFGGGSHTFDVAWVQSLPWGISLTPNVRYYTQDSANFWYGPPYPQGFQVGHDFTADTRLSAFGALTTGVKVAKVFADGWSVNLDVNFYRQRAGWRAFGDGSPGIEPFSARWFGAGISKTF
ncbi:MAG: DUF3570 domain-containing protein [Casimicrobiaceae bacterium]